MLFINVFVHLAYLQTVDIGPITTPDAPAIMLKIAECESGTKQFYDNGSLVVSKTNDYGIFQINGQWKKKAQSLGYDIMTEEGNIGFALWLYHQHGLKDWRASEHCWGQDTG